MVGVSSFFPITLTQTERQNGWSRSDCEWASEDYLFEICKWHCQSQGKSKWNIIWHRLSVDYQGPAYKSNRSLDPGRGQEIAVNLDVVTDLEWADCSMFEVFKDESGLMKLSIYSSTDLESSIEAVFWVNLMHVIVKFEIWNFESYGLEVSQGRWSTRINTRVHVQSRNHQDADKKNTTCSSTCPL